MNLLDENIRHDQGQQLRKWRIPFRLLIRDRARSGIQDAEIIPLLHRGKYPTSLRTTRITSNARWSIQPTVLSGSISTMETLLFTSGASCGIRNSTRTPNG